MSIRDSLAANNRKLAAEKVQLARSRDEFFTRNLANFRPFLSDAVAVRATHHLSQTTTLTDRAMIVLAIVAGSVGRAET